MAKKNHANEYMRTCWGRLAGNGMLEDDYSEESCGGYHDFRNNNPTIREPKEEIIPGEVTKYKLTKSELREVFEKSIKWR